MASTLADQLTESVFAYRLIDAARGRVLRELRGLVARAGRSEIDSQALTRARLILLCLPEIDRATEAGKDPGNGAARDPER